MHALLTTRKCYRLLTQFLSIYQDSVLQTRLPSIKTSIASIDQIDRTHGRQSLVANTSLPSKRATEASVLEDLRDRGYMDRKLDVSLEKILEG